MPTEADSSTPIVNSSTIELMHLPTGGRYIFTLVGQGLSLDKPRVVGAPALQPFPINAGLCDKKLDLVLQLRLQGLIRLGQGCDEVRKPGGLFLCQVDWKL